MTLLIILGLYLFSVFVNAFIVRLLNKWLGPIPTAKSLGFCAMGATLWVILLVFGVIGAGAWLLDKLELWTEDWFNPK